MAYCILYLDSSLWTLVYVYYHRNVLYYYCSL
nr:MAG TPA: hypothetical protein [Caudoviricetes sp.]